MLLIKILKNIFRIGLEPRQPQPKNTQAITRDQWEAENL